MTIEEILTLKPGDTFERKGVTKTVTSCLIIPYFRKWNQNKDSDTIDLSYVELSYNDGTMYAGPPIQLNHDVKMYSRSNK
jgi:hypothetical protein